MSENAGIVQRQKCIMDKPSMQDAERTNELVI